MTETYLHIRNLGVNYGETAALQDVSLDLAKGGRLAVIGESGSGKSTLAMAIAGLLPKSAQPEGQSISRVSAPPTRGSARILACCFRTRAAVSTR